MVLSPTNKFLGATIGGDLAPSLGERKRNFADQDFSMKYFYKRNSIFTQKISDDPFFVIDHVFQIFNIFTLLNVLYYDPFFTTKTLISQNNSLMTPFFNSVCAFAQIRQHYYLKYWWG